MHHLVKLNVTSGNLEGVARSRAKITFSKYLHVNRVAFDLSGARMVKFEFGVRLRLSELYM